MALLKTQYNKVNIISFQIFLTSFNIYRFKLILKNLCENHEEFYGRLQFTDDHLLLRSVNVFPWNRLGSFYSHPRRPNCFITDSFFETSSVLSELASDFIDYLKSLKVSLDSSLQSKYDVFVSYSKTRFSGSITPVLNYCYFLC